MSTGISKTNDLVYYEVAKPSSLSGDELDSYLSRGWYRMGQTIFTLSHQFNHSIMNFQRLWWLRFDLDAVGKHRSHRSLRRKTKGFSVEYLDNFVHTDELDNLYQKYKAALDFEGYPDIASATFARGSGNIYHTRAILIRHGVRLVAAGIMDTGQNSAAAILHFYDPEYSDFSLGKYLMLCSIEYCKALGIRWYYTGYVISGNPKMDYKLFLGREAAQAYDSEAGGITSKWIAFCDEMLDPLLYTQEEWIRNFSIFFKDTH